MRFLKRLFGSDTHTDGQVRECGQDSKSEIAPGQTRYAASDRYFNAMTRMQTAISDNNFDDAAELILVNLQCVPEWVKETCQQYGSFQISSIPALQQGGTILALADDQNGLEEMEAVVTRIAELHQWSDDVKQHHKDLRLFKMILDAVQRHPKCLQTEVKGLVGEEDGRRIATLISYLERAGKIVRIRKGRTYEILLSGSRNAPKQTPRPTIRSHRQEQNPPTLREIDFSALSYVPLPPAPSHWEEEATSRERATVRKLTSNFEVHDTDWRIDTISNIPMVERPDPAFRQIHPCESGLLMVDDLGNAEGLGNIEAAALRYDQTGNQVAMAGMQHSTYRVGVHPLGRGLIAMSRECVLHAYDDNLAPLLETALPESPEIHALRRRFDIPEDKLRNHIRCVAMSAEARSYLFTAVDEAWCIDLDGKGLWGAKLPRQEGWTRTETSASDFRTSVEVEQALDVMGLSLPITPDTIKQRYRLLTKTLSSAYQTVAS